MSGGGILRVDHLPAARHRIDDELATQVCLLDLRGQSQRAIARQLELPRVTVRRVIERTAAARALVANTAEERGRAVAVYRELQRIAWESVETAIEQGRSTTGLLAEIRLAQTRIDELLGLEVRPPNALENFETFRALIVEAVRESPELGLVLARQLQALGKAYGEA